MRLTGQQFPTVIAILYVGYGTIPLAKIPCLLIKLILVPMQVPSNIFLNKTGKPSIYIPTAMILWGILSILTGVTHK